LAAQSQELEDLLLLQLHFVRLRVARPREGIKKSSEAEKIIKKSSNYYFTLYERVL